MFGAETILMNRCRTEALFNQTVSMINNFKEYFLSHGEPVGENPSPGNKAGGISTLEDKALGCTQKCGKAPVSGVMEYGDRLTNKGLNLLSAPGNDLVASTALASCGCHIVLFTTGRGTPFGTFVPTMKVATNPTLAKIIISQLGGPDGELGAAMRYLHQRYSMPYDKVRGILTDVGTEELAHLEMIAAILYQLTRNLSPEEIKKAGMDTYFVDHTAGVYPIAASGVPFDMKYVGVKGDVIADLNEDLAAEQKARVTYDNILRMVDDPDVREPIKYLRQRELVHYQRFGDALRITQDNLDSKNFYAFNPSFD